MIRSFADKRTEAVFRSEFVRGLDGQIQQRAREKLMFLHAAAELRDLRVPPSNQLKSLAGDLEGLYSIRINKQWRICFRWDEGDALDVQIVDYH